MTQQHSALLANDATVHLHGRALVLWRVVWLMLSLLYLTVFLLFLPSTTAHLQIICADSSCLAGQLDSAAARQLQAVGISLRTYALLHTLFACLGVAVNGAVALILFWRRPQERAALMISLTLVLNAATGYLGAVGDSHLPFHQLADLMNGLGLIGVFLVLALFPGGQFAPAWSRWVVGIFAITECFDTLTPLHTDDRFALWQTVIWLGGLLCLVGCQIYRYRRISTLVQRQQTKWILFSLLLVALAEVTTFLLFVVLRSELNSLLALLVQVIFDLVLLSIPIAVGIAILRYHLFAIDLILSRTLVYALLTALVVSLYVLLVGGLSTVFHIANTPPISLVATGVIAMIFQPLRERLQRAVNRLLFGQRDDPYAVLAQFGRRLEATLQPEALFNSIVDTLTQAFKLPYVAIVLAEHDAPVALRGRSRGPLLQLPLLYQQEFVGQLQLATRAPGETFTPAEKILLTEVARQAGAAIRAAQLTTELQRARTRLVTAREEERRRLRRDLHDGLGPLLAGFALKTGAASTLLLRDPDAALRLLTELSAEIEAAVEDIRRLVYALRPPSLDELGLVGAIRMAAMQVDAEHLGLQVQMKVAEPLPPLPAAVEVATLRIVQEALTNVVRHAHAHRCQIHLTATDQLHLEISDDGVGLPAQPTAGVGLISMRERVAELGGVCAIATNPAGGVTIHMTLPLEQE